MTDTITPHRSYPLVDPDQPQRVGAEKIIDAIGYIDQDVADLLAAIALKADSASIAPAINAAISALVGAAPAALDTIYEIAAKLADEDSAIAALVATVASKADASSVYTKSQADTLLAAKADAAATTTALAAKADAAATTTALNAKADQATTYTKTQTDSAIATAVAGTISATDVRKQIHSLSLIM